MKNVQTINAVKKVFIDNVKHERMDIENFLILSPVPMQRDTEARAKTPRVKSMMRNLTRTQLEVGIVEMLCNDTYYGIEYKKGERFIVNGNTRAYFWKNALVDQIPAQVYATIYEVESMEEVRKIYNEYDNPSSMERNQEKLFGIFEGLFGFSPTCEKIKIGEILTGLNYACHKFDPNKWNQPTLRSDDLPYLVNTYIEEIKIFDRICKVRMRWSQQLLAMAFMLLKKYKHDPIKLTKAIEGLERIDQKSMNTMDSTWDGVTHICNEWFGSDADKRWPTKTTRWDKPGGFHETVSFALYWMENYMNDIKLIRVGNNWKSVSDNWFNDYHKMNTNMKNIFQLTA